jgi:hypothetical protein
LKSKFCPKGLFQNEKKNRIKTKKLKKFIKVWVGLMENIKNGAYKRFMYVIKLTLIKRLSKGFPKVKS